MSVLDEVKITYADSHLSWEIARGTRRLDWRSNEPLMSGSPELALALQAIGAYNDFDPGQAAAALAPFNVPVFIAREGSVCLYIVPKSELEAEKIKVAMLKAHADEVDPEGDEIRAWWD